MSEAPRTPALSDWYERYDLPNTRTDTADVEIRFPRTAPTARLRVIHRGCHDPMELPKGPVMVTLSLGPVRISGYLDEIEHYVDAARDALRLARHEAGELRPVEPVEVSGE